ncbi:hypothetical protein KOXY103107_15475 [Komagataeibacter xylinus]
MQDVMWAYITYPAPSLVSDIGLTDSAWLVFRPDRHLKDTR